MGKLSDAGVKFVGSLSGWTATLLFMWMPVAQMVFIQAFTLVPVETDDHLMLMH
jgi:hypothetical protein